MKLAMATIRDRLNDGLSKVDNQIFSDALPTLHKDLAHRTTIICLFVEKKPICLSDCLTRPPGIRDTGIRSIFLPAFVTYEICGHVYLMPTTETATGFGI
jgi:hypothetical protein